MAGVTLPNFEQLYQIAKTEVESRDSKLTDYHEGSVLDAHLGGSSSIGMELVYQLSRILKIFFIHTATDEDLDDRLKDYNIFRKPALAASGTLTLTRLTSTGPRLISKNTTFRCSSDNTEFYNPTDALFTTGQTEITVNVVAKLTGASGNVLSNTIDTIIPTATETINITHPVFSNGFDGETDDQLRNRFYLELSNMARATAPALVTGALRHVNVSNAAIQKVHSGYTKLFIDTGGGTPSPELLAEIQTDIDVNWRAAGEQVEVLAAQTQTVDIGGTLTLEDSYLEAEVFLNVSNAIQAFLITKEMGASLYRAELIAVVMGVNGVKNVVLTTPVADVLGQASKILRAGVINFVTA